MQRLFACFLLPALMAAADVTGKWTGSIVSGDNDPETFTLTLKQDGASIQGSLGATAGEQLPVSSGAINGSQITLVSQPNQNSVLKIELALEGDRMKGSFTATRSGRVKTGKIEVAREKP